MGSKSAHIDTASKVPNRNIDKQHKNVGLFCLLFFQTVAILFLLVVHAISEFKTQDDQAETAGRPELQEFRVEMNRALDVILSGMQQNNQKINEVLTGQTLGARVWSSQRGEMGFPRFLGHGVQPDRRVSMDCKGQKVSADTPDFRKTEDL